jgi:hypothetical protein
MEQQGPECQLLTSLPAAIVLQIRVMNVRSEIFEKVKGTREYQRSAITLSCSAGKKPDNLVGTETLKIDSQIWRQMLISVLSLFECNNKLLSFWIPASESTIGHDYSAKSKQRM